MEEIIIDGVNVAGCRFIDEYCHCSICKELCNGHCLIVKDIECKTYEDCYYKQLKRLEQENSTIEYMLHLAEQENEKLKQALQKYKDMEAKGLEEFKDVGGCWGCGIQLASDQYFNDAKKYRHTLEEIREITETITPYEVEDKRCLDKILNKINEVLEDE